MPKRVPVFRPGGEAKSKDKKERGRFHSTSRWQRARARYLSTHPLCVMCLAEGRTEAATVVHHVIDVADRPDLALDESNYQSLCKRHHDSITASRRNRER